MTSYIVGLRHRTRSKVLTIEAEDALIAALRAKYENPEAVCTENLNPDVVVMKLAEQDFYANYYRELLEVGGE
jgi:hypothetical protein